MGRPKGLLPAPGGGGSILDTLGGAGIAAGLDVVFGGESAPYAAIAPTIARLDDAPPGGGPIAGLRAALAHAQALGRRHVVLVACDMPYVTAAVLNEVSTHRSEAPVLAPRPGPQSPWEPMLGRYEVDTVRDVLDTAFAGGVRSFQRLFGSLPVDALPLSPGIERALRDWDEPDDIDAG